ncbi:carboxypeptidase-like regulatory domain-containing protein, partial [Flavobacteriales bacterium]|nr:carboxypeptidase-like regulatory domain-containing protein [Flavobacteriales bacterium]
MILLLSINSFGQKTKVYGTVTDAKTGETLPFVNVVFQGSKIGSTTDLNGKYELESYYGTDSLSASFVGYTRLTIAIKKDISQEIDFKLSEASTDLPELMVIPNEINPAHPILEKV